MTDTAKLSTRCLLLLLAVGLFLAIWSGDRPTVEKPRDAAPANRGETADRETNEAEIGRVPTVVEGLTTCPAEAESLCDFDAFPFTAERCLGDGPILESAANDERPVAEPLWSSCEIPLPADIAAGEYRAVSNGGLVKTVVLSADDLSYHGIPADVPPRDSYVVADGSLRWYFIRVERASDDASFVDDLAIPLPVASIAHVRAVSVDLNLLAEDVGGRLRADVGTLSRRFGALVDRIRRRIAVWTRPSPARDVTVDTLQEWLGPVDSSPRLSSDDSTGGPEFR